MIRRTPRFAPLRRLALVFGGIAALAGCIAVPRSVEGVPSDAEWLVLPLRSWAAIEHGEPEAVAACLGPPCAERMKVSILRLRGDQARDARAVLADPSRLARGLSELARADDNPRRADVATRISAERFTADGLSGFVIALEGEGARTRSAFGGALAREEGADLRVAFVVGDSREGVEGALRQIAARAF